MARIGSQRLALRSPRRERLARLAQGAGWFLLPTAIFWLGFAAGVFELWDGPMRLWKVLPEAIQVIVLIVCPLIAVAAAIVRLRWDRTSPLRLRRSWRLLAYGLMFVLLTGLAALRAA